MMVSNTPSRKIKWLLFSISGLLFTGLGLSLAIDAGIAKFQNQQWILKGTLALIIFNSGLSLFGRAVAEYIGIKKQ
jgi:hypothetical protein